MGSRPDGWWRDRAGAAVRLHGEIARLAASGGIVLPPEAAPPDDGGLPDDGAPPGDGGLPDDGGLLDDGGLPDDGEPDGVGPAEWIMVLEGAAKAAAPRIQAAEDDPAHRIRLVAAPGSGDDAIVAQVRELSTKHVVVVTADRELADRCRAAGAAVIGPGWLLRLLRP